VGEISIATMVHVPAILASRVSPVTSTSAPKTVLLTASVTTEHASAALLGPVSIVLRRFPALPTVLPMEFVALMENANARQASVVWIVRLSVVQRIVLTVVSATMERVSVRGDSVVQIVRSPRAPTTACLEEYARATSVNAKAVGPAWIVR